MQEFSPSTLLVLVPLLPLVGAILTVLLGRTLGAKAHLPAIAGIAAAAAVAVMLLAATARDVSPAHGPHAEAVRPVEMISTPRAASARPSLVSIDGPMGLAQPLADNTCEPMYNHRV